MGISVGKLFVLVVGEEPLGNVWRFCKKVALIMRQ